MAAFDQLTLRTARLLLRPLTEADAPSLFEMFSDAQVTRYWSVRPWTTIDPAHAMIARDRQAMAAGEQLRLGIERTADSRLLGVCTLFAFNAACRRAEIGYALAASAWGQGYMHEALHALLAYGFQDIELNRVEADVDPRNQASLRSLERLGFSREGLLRERWIVNDEVCDTVLMGLLRKEWQARP